MLGKANTVRSLFKDKTEVSFNGLATHPTGESRLSFQCVFIGCQGRKRLPREFLPSGPFPLPLAAARIFLRPQVPRELASRRKRSSSCDWPSGDPSANGMTYQAVVSRERGKEEGRRAIAMRPAQGWPREVDGAWPRAA